MHPDAIQKLRVFYTEFQCLGVVALIDYLETPMGQTIVIIGSAGFDLDNAVAEAKTEEEKIIAYWFETYKLSIGSHDGSVMPLEWLEKLSDIFGKFKPEIRERFNRCCEMLAEYSECNKDAPRSDTFDF